MLVLTVLHGPDRGRRFELPDNEPQMIGRSAESLPINDQTISRRHAELTPDTGKWFIRDLGSSNGTFVNGVRVTDRRRLNPGDQVRTGATLMLYGEDAKKRSELRMAGRNEIDVNIEHTVASNDDSMIMASPEPSQAAEFQLKVIYELTELIGSVSNMQDLLERVMDVIFEYFQADRGFIMLTDDVEAEPKAAVVRHRQTATKKTTPTGGKTEPVDVSKTIVRYVITHSKGVLSSNAMSDKRFSRGDSVQAYGIRSAMCVPIKFRDRLYGVIHLDSKIANYTYTEDQLLLLTTIGVQTGLAIARAHLYEQRLRGERLAAIGQTVASLSHSIKNIIQGLRGGAEVVELGMRKNNPKVLQGGWEIVARNLDRISNLAMNMLAYSTQRKPEIEMTNLVALLDENREMMQKHFDAKQVALLTDYAPDTPPVPIDPGGIQQAVLNLLSNALDAAEPESGVVTLGCEYNDARHMVEIKVADTGEGMTPQTMNQLFEPFHSTKGQRGTGLGLVVTKKVVEEHGGKIDVQSTPGTGTTFVLSLPTDSPGAGTSADTAAG